MERQEFKIKWPIKNPIISHKDKNNIRLKDYLNQMSNLKICMCLRLLFRGKKT